MPILYLIPSPIAPDGLDHIPPVVVETIKKSRIFIVERTRTARRFIKAIIKDFPIDESMFIEFDKHDLVKTLVEVAEVFKTNKDIALMSEAGTPCIADPGATVVNIARKSGYIIQPLGGPSSIILGLMSSGMHGQCFSFHGYLPIKSPALISKLKDISNSSNQEKITHIFIETPYRNNKLIQQIVAHIDHGLYLSVAANLNSKDEQIITKRIAEWKNISIDKVPAIFCIGKIES